MNEAAQRIWHPIASSTDLPFRHTYHGQLLGREFAVWRADDGYVNVWENRCLHRGVRLSIGINDGTELKCQYHGWRYANRTAGCTYIPAHPADAPARTICNQTYPAIERYGLIWSAEAPVGELAYIEVLSGSAVFPLRGIAVNAPAKLVMQKLVTYQFQPSGQIKGQTATSQLLSSSDDSCHLAATDGAHSTTAVFFVQPVDAGRSVIRGVLAETPADDLKRPVLYHHNQLLTALREQVEQEFSTLPQPAPFAPVIAPPSAPTLPDIDFDSPSPRGRSAPLRVQVSKKWMTALDIAAFDLVSITGQLPTYQPGAHIDVHMPNGLIRQYSLTNGPGETDKYTIAVKREAASGGGSLCMHGQVREGDVLAISEPRNNFPLRRDAIQTVFVAGGIGITPLLAMSRTLHHSGLPQTLHYFTQSRDHIAFPEILGTMAATVQHHLNLSPEETAGQLRGILESYKPAMHLYVCGPGPMLEATRKIADDLGWPEPAVHFEYFKNTNEIDDSSQFEINLARSAMTLQVAAGKTILETLRENGIELPSSCEQGACGTCVVDILEGEPEHHDVFLSDGEKQSGKRLMTCVSRAKSNRLVLDI